MGNFNTILGFFIAFCYIQSLCASTSAPAFEVTLVERGAPNTDSYRIFYRSNGRFLSPFHDIPLYADEKEKIFNMVVEIPRWTNAKMEIATGEPLNPIKQDSKNEKLRYVNNIFPYHGYIWNYGALPQTWEHPEEIHPLTNKVGDNDPLDVCEIGYKIAKRGEVIQVKVLGVLAMIDGEKTDWKVIVIDVNDPLAEKLKDINDVERVMPGLLDATHKWFKLYKKPDTGKENTFAFEGKPQNAESALEIVEETHKHWKSLIVNKAAPAKISTVNTTQKDTPGYLSSSSKAEEIVKKTEPFQPHAAGVIDQIVNKWHHEKEDL